MKMVKSLIAVAVAAVVLHGFVTPAMADQVEAEANASAEAVCETGQYGQQIN